MLLIPFPGHLLRKLGHFRDLGETVDSRGILDSSPASHF